MEKYSLHSTEQAGDGYDYISWTGVAKTGEMVYYSVSENYGNGGNYISSIKPGESTTEHGLDRK